MSAPNLTVVVEPSIGGAVIYGPLAAATGFGDMAAQLSIRLWITNNESSAVVVNTIALSFVPPPLVNPVAISVNFTVGPAETTLWNFSTADNVILPEPPPPTFTVSVWCNTFTDPKTITLSLDPHSNMVTGGAYLFPAKADDLRDGEFWQGTSAKHSAAGGGVQLFGYDMGVVAYQGDSWSALLPNGDSAKNQDYRVWGKPIYAMADGVVERSVNDKPTNPNPPADLSPPDPVEGNCFYIQHGPELMLYAHLQKGSLNNDLLPEGSPVKAGDFLGLAGNSGNSSKPHLHIHAIKGTSEWQGPPHPITFRDSYVVDRSALSPPGAEGPWVKLNGQCLPGVVSLIWPNAVLPLKWRVEISSFRAIDPLALILSGEVYVKLNLPYPPPIEVIRAYARAMARTATATEKRQALNRAQVLRTYIQAVEEALGVQATEVQEPADAAIPHD